MSNCYTLIWLSCNLHDEINWRHFHHPDSHTRWLSVLFYLLTEKLWKTRPTYERKPLSIEYCINRQPTLRWKHKISRWLSDSRMSSLTLIGQFLHAEWKRVVIVTTWCRFLRLIGGMNCYNILCVCCQSNSVVPVLSAHSLLEFTFGHFTLSSCLSACDVQSCLGERRGVQQTRLFRERG